MINDDYDTNGGRPQDRVAWKFMNRKGLPLLKPRDITALEGLPCWYYVYDMPNGDVLELEVSWEDDEWHTLVTAFNQA